MGFEQPILTGDPNQPQPVGRTPVTLSSADLIPATAGGNIADGYSSPIIDVREWPYVQIVFQTSVDLTFAFVSIVFYTDSGGTSVLGSTYYRTLNNKRITDCFATEGPFMRVFVTYPINPGTTHATQFAVRGRTAPSTAGQGTINVTARTPQTLAQRDFAALGAGASQLLECNFVQRGWATLSFQADAPGVICIVRFLGPAGTFAGGEHGLMQSTATLSRMSTTPLACPGVLMRVDVINTTGAGINVGMEFTMGPTP